MTTRPDVPEDLVYDPYDIEIDKNPHPVWKRLRDEAPLYYNEKHDFYALSRYHDVHHALQNWQDYSSARGTVLEIIKTGELEGDEIYGGETNLGMMIFSDPPPHDIARRLVQHRFSPRAIQAFEDRARYLTTYFLDQVKGQSEFDFVEDVVRPVPPMMIGHMLGIPEQDQAWLGRLVDAMLTLDPDAEQEGAEEASARQNENSRAITDYFRELVDQRTANPGEDMVTMLMESEVELDDGTVRKLDLNELVSFFMLLQAAGSETTARALGWAGVLLARHPDQRRKLVENPEKIRDAVEEVLRYEAPSPIQARLVTRDVEWYGVTVPAGSKIALLNGSAGRDERKYEDPDKFDVDRAQPLRHVSFGFGAHACLGASLARQEMRVVLEEMLKRYPEWHLDESRVKLVHTTTVRGPAHVPVEVS